MKANVNFGRIARVSLLAALLIPTLASCSTRRAYIEPGFVGIRVDKVGTQRAITGADVLVGRVTYNTRTTDIIQYPIKVQRIAWTRKDGEGITFTTGDGTTLETDVGFSINIERDKAPLIYTKYRADAESLLKGNIHDIVRSALGHAAVNYSAIEIMGKKKSQFEADVQRLLVGKLEPEGFHIDNFGLINKMSAPAQIEAAVQQTIVAEQQTKVEQARLTKVEAIAAQQVAQAESDAKRRVIAADSKAKANRIEAASLTPELLKLREIEHWKGEYPSYVGGNGAATPILNLGK